MPYEPPAPEEVLDPESPEALEQQAIAEARLREAALRERNGQWLARIENTKRERRERVANWAENVHFRRGKPFPSDSDRDRVNVNVDWAKTKAKQAALFSQVPQVRLTPKVPELSQAVPVFARLLNDELSRANVGAAVDEALLDCINASGVGACIVRYERRTQMVDVPVVDPSTLPPPLQMAAMQDPTLIPTAPAERTTSYRFAIERFSPSELLWPLEFMGSDFDQAPWIGRSGYKHWAEAKAEFGLTDADKPKVLTSRNRRTDDTIREDGRDAETVDDDLVEFDEVYYRAAFYDPDETELRRICRLVFVKGLKDPVVDEPWAGQLEPEQGGLLGAMKFPIRILTLTYVTDDAIPPSDSAIARPQVLELIKGRSQMVQQRDRNRPIRWMDVNGIDPMIQARLLQGEWQGIIPVNGNGSSLMGEVARASYPPEDYSFDDIARRDIDENWQIGLNQQGQFATGRRSASEANIVQGNYEVRLSYERARVAEFVTGIAEVLAGLIALFHPFDTLSEQERQALASWDQAQINGLFVYEVSPDSTQRMTAEQKIERLMSLMNMLAPTGYINVQPFVREILNLAGLDPDLYSAQPEPPKPGANVSFRFSGEDLTNPVALAMAIDAGNGPSPQALQAAQAMLMSPAGGNPQAPPAGPVGPPPGPPVNPPGANPLFETMTRLNRRSDDSV